ncbi:MAG: glycosyltransferase family 2 protein [Cryomorphaceae bacterium]
MKVSIITVSYNAVDTIEDTIRSVLAQDYPNLEYILVDGASTDGTLKIIEQYRSSIHKVVSEPDSGVYDAMNKGIALAEGHVIGILNADDTYSGNQIVSQVADFLQKQDIDSCYGDLKYVDRKIPEKVTRSWKSGAYRRSKFRYGWMPPHPAFFAKRQLYDTYGNFHTELKTSADYELMLRFLYRYGASSGHIPTVLVNMKTGGQSNASFSNRMAANREDRKAWELNGLKPPFFTTYLKPFRKIFQFIGPRT